MMSKKSSNNVSRGVRPAAAGVLLGAFVMLSASAVMASQPARFDVGDYKSFADGRFLGTMLNADGSVSVGPQMKTLAQAIGGPVLSAVRGRDGELYVGTAGPARVFHVARNGALTLHAKLKGGIVSALLTDKAGLVAVTAPEGSVHMLPFKGKNAPVAPRSSVRIENVDVLLDAAWRGKELLLVGGGDEGVLLSLTGKKVTVLARTDEQTLRTITVSPKGDVVVGGGEKGRVYRVEKNRLRAVYDSDAEEVTEILVDKAGRLFASIVNTSGSLKDTATKEKSTDDKDGTKKRKKRKARKVTGAEIVRIDTDDDAEVLFSSKKHAAYSLAFRRGRVIAGTGPYGRILSLAKDGGERAAILGEVEGADEITVLYADKGRLLLGTAHGGTLSEVFDQPAKSGRYRSAAFDAEQRAHFGRVTTNDGAFPLSTRTGFTDAPDDNWGALVGVVGGQQRAAPARYAQVEVTLSAAQKLSSLQLSYLVKNRAPVIQHIDVVIPHVKVTRTPREPSASRSVTFGEKPFKKYVSVPQTLYPRMTDRPSGKQVRKRGWRTVYAYAEDADKDALSYRFWMRKTGGPWTVLKTLSDEPFASFDGSALDAGEYQVKVTVDDALTNGFDRRQQDDAVSAPFTIGHDGPRFAAASAQKSKAGYRVKLTVTADASIVVVRCAVGGGNWYPLSPKDGILDSAAEEFDARLVPDADTGPAVGGVACQAVDENLNETRVMLNVR